MVATCAWSLARAIELADHSGVIFSRRDALEYHNCIMLHLRSTQWLAGFYWAEQVRIYKFRPKHHYLWHLATEALTSQMNPCVFQCFDEESFLGRIKKIGTKCHGASVTRRMFQRYLLAVALFLRAHERGQAT